MTKKNKNNRKVIKVLNLKDAEKVLSKHGVTLDMIKNIDSKDEMLRTIPEEKRRAIIDDLMSSQVCSEEREDIIGMTNIMGEMDRLNKLSDFCDHMDTDLNSMSNVLEKSTDATGKIIAEFPCNFNAIIDENHTGALAKYILAVGIGAFGGYNSDFLKNTYIVFPDKSEQQLSKVLDNLVLSDIEKANIHRSKDRVETFKSTYNMFKASDATNNNKIKDTNKIYLNTGIELGIFIETMVYELLKLDERGNNGLALFREGLKAVNTNRMKFSVDRFEDVMKYIEEIAPIDYKIEVENLHELDRMRLQKKGETIVLDDVPTLSEFLYVSVLLANQDMYFVNLDLDIKFNAISLIKKAISKASFKFMINDFNNFLKDDEARLDSKSADRLSEAIDEMQDLVNQCGISGSCDTLKSTGHNNAEKYKPSTKNVVFSNSKLLEAMELAFIVTFISSPLILVDTLEIIRAKESISK